MITPDGWLSWAKRVPGPAWKVNPGINPALLYIPHSAVGYWGGFTSRIIDGPDRASTHGWIAYDGNVTQLYPLTAQCWASGSDFPNNNGVAFENEGGFDPEDEPLTDAQVKANVDIIAELSDWKGRPLSYWRRPTSPADISATLYEHRECLRFGSAPTACPSGRIPWTQILEMLAMPDPTPPAPALPSFEAIRLGAVRAMLEKYDYRVTGKNPVGEYVVQLLEKDGSVAQPPSFIAIQA